MDTYRAFENIHLPRLMGEVRLQNRITARSLFSSEDGDADKIVLPCQWDVSVLDIRIRNVSAKK
jgi:hypothetical protein